MAFTVPDVGEVQLLKRLLGIGGTANGNLTLRLYENDPTVDENITVGMITECTAAGYAAITLTAGSWAVPTTVSGQTSTSYAQQTFTFTAGTNVFGYYITDGSNLVLIERFSSAPFVIPAAGGQIAITPTMNLE
jgi:hypothetical protein